MGVVAIPTVFVVLATMRSSGESAELQLHGAFKNWATALDEPQCAHVSREIYARGGTVADAAVATMLCLGVVLPESLGIGGGFLALYYNK